MQKFWQQLAIVTNWPILIAITVLVTLGMLSIHTIADPLATARKQGMFVAIGVVGMLLLQTVNYQKIGRWAWPFYMLSMLLLIYTIAPGVPRFGFGSVPNIKGAQAWIDFGFLHLEPAELMKLAFCMVLARYLRFRSNYRTLAGLVPPFALALVPLFLILKQPALGMALLFIPTLFAMLFVAGAKIKHLMGVVAFFVLLLPVAWFSGTSAPFFRHLPSVLKPYQRVRVQMLFTHDSNALQEGAYQQEQAMTAFGSGGLFGKGIGNIPVGGHVPEAHNDMIFAVIGEQLGLFGASILVGSYLMLFAAGVEVAGSTREPFGRLLAVGIVTLLASQAFLNLMVCLRLMPVTGITLPFISYGGSSMLASFMAAGLLLNIGQHRPIVMAKDSFEYG